MDENWFCDVAAEAAKVNRNVELERKLLLESCLREINVSGGILPFSQKNGGIPMSFRGRADKVGGSLHR